MTIQGETGTIFSGGTPLELQLAPLGAGELAALSLPPGTLQARVP